MALIKEVLAEKVPIRVRKTPEYAIFCRWLSQNDIKFVASAKKTVSSEVINLQKELDKFKKSSGLGTNTRVFRLISKKLQLLKLAQNKILKYL